MDKLNDHCFLAFTTAFSWFLAFLTIIMKKRSGQRFLKTTPIDGSHWSLTIT